MRLGAVTGGARGIDTGAVVPPAWLRLHPQPLVLRYICNTKPLTRAELEPILASGSGVVFIVENWPCCSGKAPWSAAVGEADGKAAVAALRELGAPAGSLVAYAFEGAFQGKETARAAWDAFARELRAAGFLVMLYVGPGQPFDGADLLALGADRYWAFAGKPPALPGRPYDLQQHDTTVVDGLPIDPDEVIASLPVVLADEVIAPRGPTLPDWMEALQRPLPGESPGDHVARIVRAFDGVSLVAHADKLDALFLVNEKPERAHDVAKAPTDCETFLRCVYALAGCPLPVVTSSYVFGTGLNIYALPPGALVPASEWRRAKAGWAALWKTDGKNDDHMGAFLSPPDANGVADCGSAGHENNGVVVSRGSMLSAGGKPLWKLIDVDKLSIPAGPKVEEVPLSPGPRSGDEAATAPPVITPASAPEVSPAPATPPAPARSIPAVALAIGAVLVALLGSALSFCAQ